MLTKVLKKFKNIIYPNGYKIAKSILFPSSLPSPDDLFPNAEKLYPIQPETVATPEVKQMNIANRLEVIHSNNYSLPPIHTVHLSQVIYCPRYGLICTKSGKVINKTNHMYSIQSNKLLNLVKNTILSFPDKSTLISKSEINKFEKKSGIYTIIRAKGGVDKNKPRNPSQYHLLVDVIPRLYLLNQPEYQKIDKIKLLYPNEPANRERFFIDKLAPKNVKLNVVNNLDSFYLVDQLIFPTLMSNPNCGYLPSAYLDYFRDRMLPKRESNKNNQIFISRAKARYRRMINEDELFEALKPYGFKKCYLEDMSIETQIDLFYDAESVVGIHGGGLTNMIFSRQMKVLEIFPNEFVWTHYYYLAKSLKHTYGYYHGIEEKPYVATREGQSTENRGDFRVNVSEVVKHLLELEKQH